MSLDKAFSLEEIHSKVEKWRGAGDRIVFTNGCFDLLHPGHIDCLTKAKAFGDRLIVGLNSDESVKRLKGVNRPIYNEKDRCTMLTGLEVVDAVVLFEEDTPINLIEAIVPDILVKGSDYKKGNIVGAEIVEKHGGKVELINLVAGFSTSELMRRIKLI